MIKNSFGIIEELVQIPMHRISDKSLLIYTPEIMVTKFVEQKTAFIF